MSTEKTWRGVGRTSEMVIPIVKHFLEKPEKSIPLATAESGYHPGETR
jgi:hypothetical protein